MKFFVQILRRDSLIRTGAWVLASLCLTLMSLTVLIVTVASLTSLFEIESVVTRRILVLSAQLLTLLFPAHLLTKLSPSYPRLPLWHLKLSVVSFVLLPSAEALVSAILMLQIGLWAEVVGVFWIRKLRYL